jgi:hypothetical protein
MSEMSEISVRYFVMSLLVKMSMQTGLTRMSAHGRTGRGRRQPPSLLGKQSQSGNIRSTVGQYWLFIKKKMGQILSFLWEIS